MPSTVKHLNKTRAKRFGVRRLDAALPTSQYNAYPESGVKPPHSKAAQSRRASTPLFPSRKSAFQILATCLLLLSLSSCDKERKAPLAPVDKEPPAPFTFSREWGSDLSSGGNLSGPGALVTLDDGDILVLDRFNNRVQKYGPNGDYAGAWGRTTDGRQFPFTLLVGLTRDRSTGDVIASVVNNITDEDLKLFRAGIFRADTFLTFSQDGMFKGDAADVKALKESPALDPDFKALVDVVFWNRNELLPLSLFGRPAVNSAASPDVWETIIGPAMRVSRQNGGGKKIRLSANGKTVSEFCDAETDAEGYLYLTGCLRRSDVYRAKISDLIAGRRDATLFIPRPEKVYITATADTRPDIFRRAPNGGFALYFAVDNEIFLYSPDGSPNGQVKINHPVYYASDLAFDKTGGFYISDYVADCVLHISSSGELIGEFGTRRDAPGQFAGRSFTLFIAGPDKGKTSRPAGIAGVAADTAGNVYATDAGNRRVQKFTPEGKFTAAFKPCAGETGPCYPVDIVFSANALYVSLLGPHKIVKLDPSTGAPLAAWKLGKPSPTAPCSLCGIGTAPNGDIYASDGESVYKLSPSLIPDHAWNKDSFHIPGLTNPNDIAIDTQGDFFLVGTQGAGVLATASAACRYTPQHELKQCYRIGDLYHPRSIAAAGGSVFISNSGRDTLIQLTPDGAVITKWGGEGRAPTQFQNPLGVFASPDGTVLVADNGNERIQQFKVPPITK